MTTALAIAQLLGASTASAGAAFSDVYFDQNDIAHNVKTWKNCNDGYDSEKYTGWRTLHKLREDSYWAPDMAYFAYCNDGAYEVVGLDLTVGYYDGGVTVNDYNEPRWHGSYQNIELSAMGALYSLENKKILYTTQGIKGVVAFPPGSTNLKMAYSINWGDTQNCRDTAGSSKHPLADSHIMTGKSKGTTFNNNHCKNKQSIAVNIADSGALRLADNDNMCLTLMGPSPRLQNCLKDEFASPFQQLVHDKSNDQLVLAYGMQLCLTALDSGDVSFIPCDNQAQTSSWTLSQNQYESKAYPGQCLSSQMGQIKLAACETLTHDTGHWDFARP